MKTRRSKHIRFWAKVSMAAIVVSMLMAGIGQSIARADSCSALVKEYVDWAKQTSSDTSYAVGVTMTSNQDTQVVSYTTAILKYGFRAGPRARIEYLNGEGEQYFNDRTYFPSDSMISEPFDPTNTDTLGIHIPVYGKIVLRLKSWGNGPIVVTPVCREGMVYGFSDTSPSALWTFSFNKISTPIPR